MLRMNCIVVDDEKPARDGIVDYIHKIDFLNYIDQARNSKEAIQLLQQHQIDLIFLDIQMPGNSGIELIRSLPNKPLVVFTTAFREYAVEGFELDAVDYLVKPITFSRFSNSVIRAFDLFENRLKNDSEYIFIKESRDHIKVSLNEICYLEADDDYVSIHMQDGKRHMVLKPMKDIEDQLPANFIRTHRSFIVNIRYVSSMENKSLKLGTTEIPISRSLKEGVKKFILDNRVL